MAGGSTGVVLVALGCNFGIALAKFAAAAWTGSSAMLSEAIHSLVDTSNQGLLLIGLKRAARPADERFPFGYSRELYFWSFIVAILLFSMGAGVSIYEGVQKLSDPHPLTDPVVGYSVLGVAIVLELISTWRAVSEFNARRGGMGIIDALRSSKDPALFTVALEDIAALAGLLAALGGLFAADKLAIPQGDGIASIVIGLILGAVAAFMSIEIHGLIIGEAADVETQDSIRAIIRAEMQDGGPVLALNDLRTVHLGPDDVLVAASVAFRSGETADTIQKASTRIERAVRTRHPEVRRVFTDVEPAGCAAAPPAQDSSARAASTAGAAAAGNTPAGPVPEISARPASARKSGKRKRR